jgi:5-methylcytosine-specific restriction endonuclease McrA
MEYLKININSSILVLNSDYNPINICNGKRAIILILKRKAQFIADKVIRLFDYIRIPYKKIKENTPTRNLIYKRDNHRCAYCNSKENLTIDHIIPTSRGGKNTWENMISCCGRCNLKKGNRTPDEANMPLLITPKIPWNTLYLTIDTSNNKQWKQYIFA